MGLLVKLAARNLWRNRRRTVLTASALAFGIAALIFVDSIMQGMVGMSERNLIALQTGEIQVHAPGYFDERDTLPLDITLEKQPALEAILLTPGVRAATPRIETAARLNVGWEEFPVVMIAMDPTLDREALDLDQHVEGRLPRLGAFEATVGSSLANLLDIEIGDYITLIARTRSGAIEALDFTVSGLVSTPNPTINQNHIYLPLDVVDQAFGMNQGATSFLIRLDPGISLEAGAKAIRNSLAEAGIAAEVFTWRQSEADFVALTQTSSAADMMLISIILVIALVGVTNTILLGALERTREIGTMKAMGMKEGEITRLFLLEATGIAFLAIAAGSVVGTAVNWYMVNVGMKLDTFVGDMDFGFPIESVIYGAWNLPMYLWVAIIAVITCWIAGYFPARRVARLDPATAMRD